MSDRLTILITNIWLADRAGSEVVVRDLAVGLARRGHRPIVYSPTLGAVAAEIAARGIAVIDDLQKLAETPDIVHGQHSIPAAEALIRFPSAPAIYVCHSFDMWLEAPVHFPQIGAYVAVDEACRDRLVHTEGIAPARVVILRNAVDLKRVPARPRELAARPRSALAFAKACNVSQVAAACEKLGVAYHAIGQAAGRVVADPEQEMVKFDLVFTSARGALEALCCGCAVIVCDGRGLAGLVTSRNYETLRAQNFGLRSLTEPVTVERCVEEMGRYDRDNAAVVTDLARRDADLEVALDELEKLYAEVRSGARRPTFSAAEHGRAVTRFLNEHLPRRPGLWPWTAEREGAQSRAQSLEKSIDHLTLADLKRSRLLKLGRMLRRMMGRPTPY
jgi:Glycosyltransferase Family 4